MLNPLSVQQNFDGLHARDTRETFPQDAQKGRPARPQPKKAPEAKPLGYVEDAFEGRTTLADFFSILLAGAQWNANTGHGIWCNTA